MKKTAKNTTAILAFVASLFTVPVQALTVWDPTNFVMNAQSAIAEVGSEISSATTAMQSVRQTIELVRMGTSINGLAKLAGLEEELRLYQDVVRINQQLTGVINDTKGLYQNLNAQFGASNRSWEGFLKGRQTMETARARYLLDRYEQTTRSMDSLNKRRVDLLRKVDSTNSQLEATQAVSGQIDVLISQNQQMMGLLANQIANEGVDMMKNKEEDAANQIYRDHQRKMRNSANTLLDRMNRGAP
ncbi:hypothetical protein [Noviherbaspirillum malthae]|uniref:hypothetical protein n=1 Tax=Noviherbaspirillum malthae TaxID=1260987 RepID=UPI0018906A90|nr:hypothetical protein [Noviherbaspirillum malthae]